MPSSDHIDRKTRGDFRSPAPQAGFTLIEVLVVLAIISLAAVTVTWAMKPMRDRAIVMRTGNIFKTLSAMARARAVEKGETIALSIDPQRRALNIPVLNQTERLPSDVAVNWISASLSGHRSGDASILFMPDGTSTGGRLSAQIGNVTATVRISWVSGAAIDEP